jgi:hypothetical protein
MSVALTGIGPKHPGWAVLALLEDTGMPLCIVMSAKDADQ